MTKKKVEKVQPLKKVVINLALAKKIIALVSKGLSEGMGERKPGQMCVEAAVAYAIGDENHHDRPRCVIHWLASVKIGINDYGDTWTSNKRRGLGLRRLAIAQLGSAYVTCDQKVFWSHVNALLFKEAQTLILAKFNAMKSIVDFEDFSLDSYSRYALCMDESDVSSYMRDLYNCGDEQGLARACEVFVQALILMKIPGTKFLSLAPVPNFKKAFN